MKKSKKTVVKKKVAVPALHDDQVKAQDIRERLGKTLEAVCLLLDEATMHGLAVSFNLKATDDGKRTLIQGININRVL